MIRMVWLNTVVVLRLPRIKAHEAKPLLLCLHERNALSFPLQVWGEHHRCRGWTAQLLFMQRVVERYGGWRT